MIHSTLEKAPRHLWMQLLAVLPVCVGCCAVLDSAPGEFCAECMERSRDSAADELGGES